MTTGCSWWKPPGAMDATTDVDISRLSFASGSSAVGARSKRRSSSARASAITAAVDQFLAAPSTANAGRLLQLARKPSVLMLFFAAHHAPLTLQLLDTLAMQIFTAAPPIAATMLPTGDDDMDSAVPQTQAAPDCDSSVVGPLLELVYLFSRRAAIGYPSHAVSKLLQWLADNITVSALHCNSDSAPLLKLQLLTMTEMVKISSGVQIFVKEMHKVKEFYRALTIVLNSTEDPELLVFSMTVLARLVLSDSVGNKLFSAKNVDQVLELVFSVLDGTCQASEPAYTSESILSRQTLLQLISVDLLCDLSARNDVQEVLEKHAHMGPTIDNFVMAINLNGNADQLQLATHVLLRVAGMSHHFRKLVIKALSDFDIFCRVLQTTLHPSKLVAILSTQLVLKILGDDIRPFKSLFESSTEMQRLTPIVTGMFRSVAEMTDTLQLREGAYDALRASEQYLHVVEGCQLLAKMCQFPTFRALCAQNISFNQVSHCCSLQEPF